MSADPASIPRAPVATGAVVIGAGPAGLAVAACLARRGVGYALLERDAALASSWRRHYDRLHLHTHKRFSALPHAPWPRAAPAYPSRRQVIEYLERYATRFGLEPRVGEEALAVRACAGGGEWEVETPAGRYRTPSVVVATGFDAVPHRPTWPGLAEFAGSVVHSSEYRDGEPYRGRRVLVVGFGNSGGEIAVDLHEHGARPTLAVRSPVNVVPKLVFGIPIEFMGRLLDRLPDPLADTIGRAVRSARYGDLPAYGLRFPPYGATRQIRSDRRVPIIDVGTVDLIRSGAVAVRPGIERFTPQGAVFDDGTSLELDAVVLATGYRPGFAAFLPTLGAAGERLRRGEAGEPEALPGLFFCGFVVTVGGRLHAIRQQAPAIARRVAERDR